jgi:hypothetical protein
MPAKDKLKKVVPIFHGTAGFNGQAHRLTNNDDRTLEAKWGNLDIVLPPNSNAIFPEEIANFVYAKFQQGDKPFNLENEPVQAVYEEQVPQVFRDDETGLEADSYQELLKKIKQHLREERIAADLEDKDQSAKRAEPRPSMVPQEPAEPVQPIATPGQEVNRQKAQK